MRGATTLIAITLILALIACAAATNVDYTEANAKVHRMKNDLMNQKKTHPFIKDYEMCRKEEDGLSNSLSDAKKKLEELEQHLKKAKLRVKMQLELIDALKKDILEAQARHDKESAPKIKELEAQLAILLRIEKLADDLFKKNPKRKEVVDKVKALIEKMRAEFQKLIDDLKISPEVEKLKHKLAEAIKTLKALEAQVKRTEEAIAAQKKVIADLVDELNKKGAECQGIKSNLEVALAKLDKMIEIFQKILDMLKKVSDGTGASGSAAEKADPNAVKALLATIIDKLKKELAKLVDPSEECAKKEAELRKKIDAKGAEEKALAEELEKIKKRIADLEAQLTKLLGEASALEGVLNEKIKECKRLQEAIVRDPALDAELKAIAEILELIHKLEGEKSLEKETGDKMEAIIVKLRNEIIAAIEKKLAEAMAAYNKCKAEEKAAHDAWKAKYSEAEKTKVDLKDAKNLYDTTNTKLEGVRQERKALLSLLDSLMARCANAKAAYEKLKKEHLDEIELIKQAIALL
mmetsp:Transcript_3212/g.4744  ORF Transcript_3212/g.4744 Transcript_3212/m.4744 type:complete len:522 (+) Transcript_3212:41-1606(+)